MAEVMIGIDPHKSSHTAVAISAGEEPLGELQVHACPSQAEQLLAWAAAWPERAWAVEGAGGLGRLLAQQLVVSGERVVDVQPKLAARVRLLQAGDTNKNDPNDAFSVAVAALRSPAKRPVLAEDHAAVLKVWAKRHRDLARSRNQTTCRLHAALCDLVPGGVRKEITAGQAARILEQVRPSDAVATARCELAAEFLTDLRRRDAQLRDTNKKLAAAVRASGTSLTGLFGVGPVIAGTVIGDVRQVFRFPSRDHFAAYDGTAPVEVSSGGRQVYRLSLRGNRRLNHAIHMAAITQIRHKHSQGRAYYERKLAEGKTHKEALRALNRRISDAIYAALVADARHTAAVCAEGPGGQPGNHSVSRAASSHPARRLFGQATPGPATTLRPSATAGRAPNRPNRAHQRPAGHPAATSKKPHTTT
jgi:transposase